MTEDRSRFDDGYARANRIAGVPPAERDGMTPPEWFAHPLNRPSPGDRDDFRDGYAKRVKEIAETEGWTPTWPRAT